MTVLEIEGTLEHPLIFSLRRDRVNILRLITDQKLAIDFSFRNKTFFEGEIKC